MSLLFAFAFVLFLAVLISDWANRSVISSSVLFLGAGLLVGTGWIPHTSVPSFNSLRSLAELALFSVLFSDGIRTGGLGEIRKEWKLAGRALLIGMPLTIMGIAAAAHYIAEMPWPTSLLFGAVLSPTDPVFVAAIFQVRGVPDRIKRALNLESGLNDGLALPAVLILLNVTSEKGKDFAQVSVELIIGIALGVLIAWLAVRIESSSLFHAVGVFEPLLAFSIGLLILATCIATGANEYLGAYVGGVTVATTSKKAADSFYPFGEIVSELMKLAALLVFGAIMATHLLTSLRWQELVLVPIAVFAVRPIAIAIACIGRNLTPKELWTFGWFGPKGFASVIYGLLVYNVGLRSESHLIALGVIASIVVFSSTDLLVARIFRTEEKNDSV